MKDKKRVQKGIVEFAAMGDIKKKFIRGYDQKRARQYNSDSDQEHEEKPAFKKDFNNKRQKTTEEDQSKPLKKKKVVIKKSF